MYNLIEATAGFAPGSLTKVLFIGITVFGFLMILMVFLFGVSVKKSLSTKIGVLALFAMSLSLPFIISRISSTTVPFASHANEKIQILNMESVRMDEKTVLISFNTNLPVRAYIEYHSKKDGSIIPILPTYSLTKRKDHSFLIELPGPVKGEILVVIDGIRYTFNGKPFSLDL